MSLAENTRYPDKYQESELYKLYPDLYEAIFIHKRNVLISGLGGCGKCWPPTQLIMLADGSVKMAKDILITEQVMGDDSGARNILDIDGGEDNMYELITENGDSYQFTLNHMLTLKCTLPVAILIDERYRVTYYDRVKGTVDYEDFSTLQECNSFCDKQFSYGSLVDVPLINFIVHFYMQGDMYVDNMLITRLPVEFPRREVYSPYLFGFFLGRDRDNIAEECIPVDYLRNSREYRLELLAGLIDSCGTMVDNHYYEVERLSHEIIDDIVYLVRSLGFYGQRTVIGLGDKNKTYNNLQILGNGLYDIPVRMPTNWMIKSLRQRDLSSAKVVEIRYLGKKPYVGFRLDGNQRFLLGDFTVTHNSHTVREIKKECIRLSIQCDLTSTTGASAYALGYGASTIHRFSSIKLGKQPLDVIVKNIRQNSDKLKRWRDAKILVIDEASMLGARTLELISKVGQEVRLGRKEVKALLEAKKAIPPFGGVQVIFSADFLQLPPINDEFSFQSVIWRKMNLYSFRVVHPYRYPDPEHFKMLSRVRVGEFTDDDVDKLQSRVRAYEEYRRKERAGEMKESIKPTRIYSLKKDVETINLGELDRLDGDAIVYEADDTIVIKIKDNGKPVIDPDQVNMDEYVEYMDSIVPGEIILKPGAQVMLTKNLSIEQGLINGARGVVKECYDERVVVGFKCGIEVDVVPQAYEYEDEKVTIVRQQFPLILAWSITCHRCQGATLDYAIIDMGSSLFSANMGYVMLSRCKTLEGIYITSVMREMIRADKTALVYERQLVEVSVIAREVDNKENKSLGDYMKELVREIGELDRLSSIYGGDLMDVLPNRKKIRRQGKDIPGG